MRKVTVNFNFEQSSTTERTVKSINLNLGEIIGKSMGFGKWQISITSLLISGLYLGNVHIQIYHKASPDQEKGVPWYLFMYFRYMFFHSLFSRAVKEQINLWMDYKAQNGSLNCHIFIGGNKGDNLGSIFIF